MEYRKLVKALSEKLEVAKRSLARAPNGHRVAYFDGMIEGLRNAIDVVGEQGAKDGK
jgi:hypothetical protein